MDRAALRADTRCYTAAYCEENVCHLARRLLHEEGGGGGRPCVVLLISNAARACPVWHQQAAADARAVVVWDYHVVLLVQGDAGGADAWLVYDLDSTLPFPCALAVYVSEALRPHESMPPQYRQRFRAVAARDYLALFASDRRHMRRADGSWAAPPPPGPPIRGSDAPSSWTLGALWDVADDGGGGGAAGDARWGRVMSLEQLARFGV